MWKLHVPRLSGYASLMFDSFAPTARYPPYPFLPDCIPPSLLLLLLLQTDFKFISDWWRLPGRPTFCMFIKEDMVKYVGCCAQARRLYEAQLYVGADCVRGWVVASISVESSQVCVVRLCCLQSPWLFLSLIRDLFFPLAVCIIIDALMCCYIGVFS